MMPKRKQKSDKDKEEIKNRKRKIKAKGPNRIVKCCNKWVPEPSVSLPENTISVVSLYMMMSCVSISLESSKSGNIYCVYAVEFYNRKLYFNYSNLLIKNILITKLNIQLCGLVTQMMKRLLVPFLGWFIYRAKWYVWMKLQYETKMQWSWSWRETPAVWVVFRSAN